MTQIIKIPGRIESTATGNVVTGANSILDDGKGKKQNVINSEVDAELVRLEQNKQNNLTFDNAPTEDSENPVKSGGVYAADKALSDAIEAILLLIPSAASALNQLADKNFVNSSISTATATPRGTYNLVSDLDLTTDATRDAIAEKLGDVIDVADLNDYAFVQVPVSDDDPTEIERTERYKFNGNVWIYEYTLNTSGFTAAQWDAINSGVTSAIVGDLNAIKTYIPSEATALNQLADKAYVLTQILLATPSFKGQFTTLTQLEEVEESKAGDLGIVRTKDTDGHDVFTFYQYLDDQWNEYYVMSYHPQDKPATTGWLGDYPYNGMGRIELPMNMVDGWPDNTWIYLPKNDVVYLLYSWHLQIYAVYNPTTQEGLGLDDNLVVKPENYDIADLDEIVNGRYLSFTENGGVWTIEKPDERTITSTELNNTNIYHFNDPTHQGVNLLVQSMINQANTIYVIQYDYDLNGESVTIPENCVLEFDGGSLNNGILFGNNTILVSYRDIEDVLINVKMTGTWKQEQKDRLYAITDFGQFLRDIESGQDLGYNQALAVTEDYFFLIFSQDKTYTDGTTTIGVNVCVLYDRNFNYLGYAPLDKYSHPNGATVVDDNILICISSRSLDPSVSFHRINADVLAGICRSNKGQPFEYTIGETLTSNSLNVAILEEVRVDGRFISMDYDSIREEYAVVGINYDLRLYDKSFNVLYEHERFIFTLADKVGRGLTQQDIGYKDGLIYMPVWDHNYILDGGGDSVSSAAILFVINPVTGEVLSETALTYDYVLSENEGICKDPITGDFYGSCNTHDSSQPAGMVVVHYSYKYVPGIINHWKFDNNKYINQTKIAYVYVDNSYTGISNGGKKYPFKTLGEALMLTPSVNRPNIRLISGTGIPYYCYYFFNTDSSLRIDSDASEEENYPILDIYGRIRYSQLALEYVTLKDEKPHPSASSRQYTMLYVQQYSSVSLFHVKFIKSNPNVMSVLRCYDGFNDVIISNFSASNEINDTKNAAILVNSDNNRIVIRNRIYLNKCILVNAGLGETKPFNTTINIDNLDQIVGEGDPVTDYMITSDASQMYPRNLFLGVCSTLSQINVIKEKISLFHDRQAYFYFTSDKDLVTQDGTYTNGYYYIDKGKIVKENVDSDYRGDGVNLFNDPGFKDIVRRPIVYDLALSHFRETTNYVEGYIPQIVDVVVDSCPEIKKGVLLKSAVGNEYSCSIVQDIQTTRLTIGNYVCSMYIKGHGILRVGFYTSKEVEIDGETQILEKTEYIQIDINSSEFTKIKVICPFTSEIYHFFDDYSIYPNTFSFNITARYNSDTDIIIAAPKLERGTISSDVDFVSNGRSILLVGDSILEATRNNNMGFLPYINYAYKNDAIGGSALCYVSGGTKSIPQQLIDVTDFDPDIIIAGTGINDWHRSRPLGIMPTTPVKNDTEEALLNINTTLGGLQKLFYQMIKKFPNAKRYFMSTHRTYWRTDTATPPVELYYTEKNSATVPYSYADLMEDVKKICKLYGVIYIDVLNEGIMDTAFNAYIAYDSDTQTTHSMADNPTDEEKALWNELYYCDGDGVHPFDRGYKDCYAPIIRRILNVKQ